MYNREQTDVEGRESEQKTMTVSGLVVGVIPSQTPPTPHPPPHHVPAGGGGGL